MFKLKEIDLSFSSLTSCPDLSGFPNLERLILFSCFYLREISPSIQYLNKLDFLYLRACKSLKSIPDCRGLISLKKLDLRWCLNLEKLPEMPCNIEELLLSETAIEELPLSIKYLSRLVVLEIINCKRLKSLPSSICEWKSLKSLPIYGCSKLDELPDDIGTLEYLKAFNISGTAIRELPSSITKLKNVDFLLFRRFKVQDAVSWSLPHIEGWHNLTSLNLRNSGIIELPDNLGCLSSLIQLDLARNNFESIPASITNLSNLLYLYINDCKMLKCLPKLELFIIDAYNCTSLEASAVSFRNCFQPMDDTDSIEYIDDIFANFGNCFKLDRNTFADIVKDILVKIRRYTETLRSEIDFPGSEWPNWSRIPRVGICFPGSEIPDWFNFQKTGCFITIKLRSGWFSNNFIGFAMCTVVAFRNYQDDGRGLNVRSKCTLERQDGRGNHIGYGSLYEKYSGYHDGPRCISSDHVFMGFDFFMRPRDNGDFPYKNRVSFQVYLSNSKCCEVKRCGVCLLYDRDVGEFSGSFSFAGDKEEPHPKRMKFL
ncbi:hypothetical protein ACOSQ4_009169 [Xanthoceras sorbifolium]